MTKPVLHINQVYIINGVPCYVYSMTPDGIPKTENEYTTLPDFICLFVPCDRPNSVHPICAAMATASHRFLTPFPTEFAKRVHEVHSAQVNKQSDSKPMNRYSPESEDTPPHNPVMGPVVGTTQVKFHDQSKTIPPEVGKRYVCRNGDVTDSMTDDGGPAYPFMTGVNNVPRSWKANGRHDPRWPTEYDLISEYHEPEPSQPSESPDDWVPLTDPNHVIRRVDECRKTNDRVWTPCCASVGATIGEWKNLEFRCRRKDLPAVPDDNPLPQPWNPMIGTPSVETALRQFVEWHDMDHEEMKGSEVQAAYDKVIADAKAALQADADKPRMRTIELSEHRYNHSNKMTVWSSRLLSDMYTTGRTYVTEVPE